MRFAYRRDISSELWVQRFLEMEHASTTTQIIHRKSVTRCVTGCVGFVQKKRVMNVAHYVITGMSYESEPSEEWGAEESSAGVTELCVAYRVWL